METVSLKLDNLFLKDIQRSMKKHRYETKTEFIRQAIRDKLKALEHEETLSRLRKLYGSSFTRTTDKALHKAGEQAFKEIERDIT